MSANIWFGNRRHMGWYKPFREAPELTHTGRSVVTDYLVGGAGIDQSMDAHAEFTLIWNTDNPDRLSFVTDFANGRYGKELMYWTDPMYARRNALPASWSMPWIAAEDAIPLVLERRPTLVDTPANAYGYPVHGASYTMFSTDTARKVMVPIPPGYTAHVGVHGNAAAENMVKVTPYEGLVAGAVTHPAMLDVTSATRVNASFAGTGQSWIELAPDLASIPAGEGKTFELYAMEVQVIKTGAAPKTGAFVAGMGHSGCSFRGKPKLAPINAALDTAVVTATFLEVGAWA